MRFADEVAERHGLDPAWVRAALGAGALSCRAWRASSCRRRPARRRTGPPTARASSSRGASAPASRSGTPTRTGWRAPRSVYGVPPEIVVGIVGVETIYGQQMGNFRVIDALATLAFDFPAGRKDRSAFFRGRARAAASCCASASGAATRWRCKGSYAGAIGMPQFMPRSVNKYAVDFDGDGHIDLHDSAADVIGSVAHYLAEFGWQRGMPTHFAVSRAGRRRATARRCSRPTSCRPSAPHEFAERGAVLPPDGGERHDGAARAGRTAERRRRAELRRRHEQLLRDHALQLVELLRDGGDRARRGGAGGPRPRIVRPCRPRPWRRPDRRRWRGPNPPSLRARRRRPSWPPGRAPRRSPTP